MAGLGGWAGLDREIWPYEGLRFDGRELTECDGRCEDFGFLDEGRGGLPSLPFSEWPFICRSLGFGFFLVPFVGGRFVFLSKGIICVANMALAFRSRRVRSMAFCRSKGRGLHSAQECAKSSRIASSLLFG